MTVAGLLGPRVLHEGDGLVVWAAVTRVGDALVADVRALPTSRSGARYLEPTGATLVDQGRPRLSWALLVEDGECPLPLMGTAAGSERSLTCIWTAELTPGARAVRVRVELPLFGVAFDETLPLW